MKLRYLLPMFLAALALLASCSDDDDPSYLDGLRVTQSYLAFPTEGGSVTITVTADGPWQLENLPEWVSAEPASGEAGQTQVTFTTDSTATNHEATIQLVCGDKTQEINLIQQAEAVEAQNATCADVIAGDDGKTYRVRGTCTKIANTTYGNWYLTDETGQIYIYGTLDANGGTKNFLSWNMEVGDIVTVEGPRKDYNGTIELVDVTVISIEKSLIKVDSTSLGDQQIPLEGGDFIAYLTCKGDGISVEIPDEAKSWLSITGINTGSPATVSFRAAENTGGDRSTTVVFKTTSEGQEYTAEVTISQAGAIVSATVAEFLAAETGETQYRVTGVIQSVKKASYGNIYLRDFSGETYVYGIGSKGDFEALGLKEGDIVTLVGQRSEYNGEPQMKGAQYESHISVTDISIADFLKLEDSKEAFYRVKGVITSIANTTYGNLYLADEDGANELYVYGCYPGYGATGDARKNHILNADIEVGDTLTVIGYKTTYNGTVELYNGIYFSHEKGE